MNFKLIIATLLATFGLFTQVQSAVTVTDISQEQFTEYTTTNPVAWQARFQPGSESGSQTYQVYLSANTVEYGTHTWDWPDTVSVSGDGAGNIYASVGSTTINVQPLLLFDVIVIRAVDDFSAFGNVSFDNGLYNTTSLRDMYANNGVDYLMIELGEENPVFSLAGDLDAAFTGGSIGRIEFYGVNMPSVPEPSTALLMIPFFLLSMLRRSRT